MFKKNWEKTSTLVKIDPSAIDEMVESAYPGAHISSMHTLEGGCANLNIHMTLEGHANPLLLRIYVRDPESSHIEQSIETLLHPTLPVPQTYAVGSVCGFQFAFKEFMEGIPLRDLLLSELPCDLNSIMYEVGQLLSNLSNHHFPRSGFFEENLTVGHSFSPHFAKDLFSSLLMHSMVIKTLEEKVRDRLHGILDRFAYILANPATPCLVHGDFDPANILVQEVDGTWHISALLDFEFAHAGSSLMDIATMLRYAHLMPAAYEEGFLDGLRSQGFNLEADLTTSISLLNCLALLEILARTNPQKSPNQLSDIKSLIPFFIDSLDI